MAAAGTGCGLRTSRVAPQAVEQRQLGVAVRLPRPVELEVLVGEVGQDRDVVGDARHAVEGEAVRGRLDDRDVVAGVDHRAERRLQLRRLRGRGVRLVGLGPAADAGRDRADHPGAAPGRLEGRDGEVGGRRLAVRAGDADDGQVDATDRRTTTPPRWPAPAGPHRRRAAATASSGSGRSTMRAAAPGRDRGRRRSRGRRRARRGWPRTACPGATARESWVTPRDVDVGERGAAGGAAVEARAAQPSLGASRVDELAEARGVQVRQPGVPGGIGHRPASLAARAASRPSGVAPRPDDPLVRAGHLDPRRPERALVLVQPGHRVALAGLRVVRADVDAAEVHLRPALADGQLDRPPAEQVHDARDGCRARPARRPSGPSTAARRGGTGAGRRGRARVLVVARLEVDDAGRPRGRPSTSRGTRRAARTGSRGAGRSPRAGSRTRRGPRRAAGRARSNSGWSPSQPAVS